MKIKRHGALQATIRVSDQMGKIKSVILRSKLDITRISVVFLLIVTVFDCVSIMKRPSYNKSNSLISFDTCISLEMKPLSDSFCQDNKVAFIFTLHNHTKNTFIVKTFYINGVSDMIFDNIDKKTYLSFEIVSPSGRKLYYKGLILELNSSLGYHIINPFGVFQDTLIISKGFEMNEIGQYVIKSCFASSESCFLPRDGRERIRNKNKGAIFWNGRTNLSEIKVTLINCQHLFDQ